MCSMPEYYNKDDFMDIYTKSQERVVGVIESYANNGVNLKCYGHIIFVPFSDVNVYDGEKRRNKISKTTDKFEVLPSTYTSLYGD